MSYKPSVALHPGLTVARELDAIGETHKWLAVKTGLSEKQITKIISGLAPITTEMAIKLEYALGGSATFWVHLNSNYLFTKEQQKL